jgi:hypothetical protein
MNFLLQKGGRGFLQLGRREYSRRSLRKKDTKQTVTMLLVSSKPGSATRFYIIPEVGSNLLVIVPTAVDSVWP